MRRVLLAHHTALIGRPDMETWIDRGAHELRSLFGLAQRYRLAGVSRDDMAANNARAREAIDKFGTPPSKILEGSHRSQFAPPITRVPQNRYPLGRINTTNLRSKLSLSQKNRPKEVRHDLGRRDCPAFVSRCLS